MLKVKETQVRKHRYEHMGVDGGEALRKEPTLLTALRVVIMYPFMETPSHTKKTCHIGLSKNDVRSLAILRPPHPPSVTPQ